VPVRERASTSHAAEPTPLEAPSAETDENVLARVWVGLNGSLESANGDVLKLNAALREWFVAFDLSQLKYTGVRVVPVMSAVALSRTMTTPPAFSAGHVSAVALGEDGGPAQYWGSHLVENPVSGGKSSSTGNSELLE
jgi:hypothetical protein